MQLLVGGGCNSHRRHCFARLYICTPVPLVASAVATDGCKVAPVDWIGAVARSGFAAHDTCISVGEPMSSPIGRLAARPRARELVHSAQSGEPVRATGELSCERKRLVQVSSLVPIGATMNCGGDCMQTRSISSQESLQELTWSKSRRRSMRSSTAQRAHLFRRARDTCGHSRNERTAIELTAAEPTESRL